MKFEKAKTPHDRTVYARRLPVTKYVIRQRRALFHPALIHRSRRSAGY
jgi:hypothetical protein